MIETHIYHLLMSERSGTATAAEQAELAEMRLSDSGEVRQVEQIILHTEGLVAPVSDLDERWNALSSRLTREEDSAGPKRKIWPLLLIVSLLLLLMAGAYFWAQKEAGANHSNEHVTQADLPDGSMAYAFQGSDLTPSSTYGREKRQVYAEGDVYIEATHSDLPMVVSTEIFDISVLGTRFSIMDYEDEAAGSITLYEGRVAVTLPHGQTVSMTAHQHLFWSATKASYEVQSISADRPSWLEGSVKFDNTPFEEVLLRLARMHKVTFTGGEILDGLHFSDQMTDPSLEAVLRRIETVAQVRVLKMTTDSYHITKR